MDIGSILLGLALFLIVAFIVARPLIQGDRFRERQPGPADQLLAERERVFAQLRDLDFDHDTGKLRDEDHAAQRAGLVARGVEILKQLDALTASLAPGGANGRAGALDGEIEAAVEGRRGRPPRAVDAEIEARLAARRGAPAPVFVQAVCAECGTTLRAEDRFCPQCGAALAVNCAACGRPVRMGDQFCGGCGQRLPAAAPGLSQAPG